MLYHNIYILDLRFTRPPHSSGPAQVLKGEYNETRPAGGLVGVSRTSTIRLMQLVAASYQPARYSASAFSKRC